MTLTINNLSYHIADKQILTSLSFEMYTGVLYGVCGLNGAGKSTLLKILSGLIQPINGSILWKGQNLKNLSRQLRSQIFAYVPQQTTLRFNFDVFSIVAMGLYARNIPKSLWKEEVIRFLEMIEGLHLIKRKFNELSGGEQQLIYIARALATEAPVLLLDEPMAHLDLWHQLRVWDLLRSLKNRNKLIITTLHDLSSAKRYCDRLILMQRGKSLEQGDPDTILKPEILSKLFGIREDSGRFILAK